MTTRTDKDAGGPRRGSEIGTPRLVDRDGRPSLLTDFDLHLFNEGSHFHLYDRLGAHVVTVDGQPGTMFGVWAPNAERVSVIGDFNGWNRRAHPLAPVASSGIWEGFVPDVGPGALYKYRVVSRHGGYAVDKLDPFATRCELPPRTAAVVWPLGHVWQDAAWMRDRAAKNSADAPISIYEVHFGSWLRADADVDPSYREVGPRLIEHVRECGFTHVEFMPLTEHPFRGSWGYQTTAYFAPTARFGTPDELQALIDELHRGGIGVILDWVPSHFPADEHGLVFFDGTHLFEHADPRRGFHPDWNSCIFDYGRREVASFLISSALFWLSRYHIDGLRVDAVASMLYLDYSRAAGEWLPNERGGRENLEAVAFLERLNQEIERRHPDVQTIAEESTAWPGVTKPVAEGGLGFGFKWDMGWMHDTLSYFRRDPVHRRFHHDELTFKMMYAYAENFILSLSHDEVVYGKGSLLAKMPGDEWQKFANLRLLLAYMFAQPGKKLLFMGAELAQPWEWNHDGSLGWHLLDHPRHAGVRRLVADLNAVYRDQPALHALDHDPHGFAWLEVDARDSSRYSFLRRDRDEHAVVVAFNCTPVVWRNYRLGVPRAGVWRELLNTDSAAYGGSGQGNLGVVEAAPIPAQGLLQSVSLTLPPLAAIFLGSDAPAPELEASDEAVVKTGGTGGEAARTVVLPAVAPPLPGRLAHPRDPAVPVAPLAGKPGPRP